MEFVELNSKHYYNNEKNCSSLWIDTTVEVAILDIKEKNKMKSKIKTNKKKHKSVSMNT